MLSQHRSTFYRGTDIPLGSNIMYAMNRTATIALPMSSIVCLSTATSLNSNRNALRAMARDSNISHKNPQRPHHSNAAHAARANAAHSNFSRVRLRFAATVI
jgi:hypothetical protein